MSNVAAAILLAILGLAAIVIAHLTCPWRREYRIVAVGGAVIFQNVAFTVLQAFGFSRAMSANLSFAITTGCLVVTLGVLMSFAVPVAPESSKK